MENWRPWPQLCRVPHTAKFVMSVSQHSAKHVSRQEKKKRKKNILSCATFAAHGKPWALLSVMVRTLGKPPSQVRRYCLFAECYRSDTRQRGCLPSVTHDKPCRGNLFLFLHFQPVKQKIHQYMSQYITPFHKYSNIPHIYHNISHKHHICHITHKFIYKYHTITSSPSTSS